MTGGFPIGGYRPGRSVLHRAPAGLKLLLLGAGLLALGLVHSPAAIGLGTLLVLGFAALARIPPAALLAQVRPVLGFTVVIAALQLWLTGPQAAIVVAGSLLLGVAAAGLVTLTTRTEQLLDVAAAAARPLRPIGVEPERVALLLALTIRTVPVLAGLVREVREARQARGLDRSMRALVVPLVIRAVQHADQLGQALAARGVDD